MATAFDRWEKDPFFYAAEEVQESADRLESVYRRWMHGRTYASKQAGIAEDGSTAELRRELYTALGTAKWQLDELEKAAMHSDEALSAGEATVIRHSDFVSAISCRISIVEKAMKELNLQEEGRSGLSWVRLDEGERNELALFLTSPNTEANYLLPTPIVAVHESGKMMNWETSGCSVNPCSSNDSSSVPVEERLKGHRKAASASAEFGGLEISVCAEESSPKIAEEKSNLPPPRIQSLSELNIAESALKLKWYRNGFRKWKPLGQEDLEDSLPLRNHQLSRGMNACYERSKSCLSDYAEETSNKHLYGWLGAIKRQLQRSQYQIQYGRPNQIIAWAIFTMILIVFFVLRAI